jgi:O-methyltransferase
VTLRSRVTDRFQRSVERRLISWYARRTVGSEPERCYELAERLSRLVYPDYWFSEYGRTWLQDTEFLRWYEQEEPNNRHSADRKYTLRELTGLVTDVPGDIAECGVYRGASAELMGRALPGRQLHLFDSFEGLSEPDGVDGAYWRRGDLTADESAVHQRMQAAGLAHTVHKGWIPERFADINGVTFALVHIDVDLYQPTLDSISFFYPRLARGGLIIFDDYGFESCPGARRAVDEYMANKSEGVVRLTTGQALLQKV